MGAVLCNEERMQETIGSFNDSLGAGMFMSKWRAVIRLLYRGVSRVGSIRRAVHDKVEEES